jgi:hypothetical protein
MSNEPRDYAFREYKYKLLTKIYRIPLESSWDNARNNWKAKIICQGGPYGREDIQIHINLPKQNDIEFPTKENTGEGIPICISKKYQWLLIKISDCLYGVKHPDVFQYDSCSPAFYADVVFARYPTLLKKYPSWNEEAHSRILQYILDAGKDIYPENYKELRNPLSEIEMETYEAEFALRGVT